MRVYNPPKRVQTVPAHAAITELATKSSSINVVNALWTKRTRIKAMNEKKRKQLLLILALVVLFGSTGSLALLHGFRALLVVWGCLLAFFSAMGVLLAFLNLVD